MTHLGVYYAPEHSRQSDRDYIAALQPPVIRLLDPDVQQIADMHALAPNAIIAPRTWIIDDNSGAAVRNFMADPIGTGRDHANQYRGQLDRWQQEAQQRGLKLPSPDRIYFNAANEPNQGGSPDKIAAYNVAFLDRCTELNIRAAALCLGVGWPDNTGPDTPVDWTPYAALPAAIKRGQHWLELHEYNYKTGPQDGWRWLAGRHLQCPFDVPILLGEIGVDNYVDKPRWDKEGGNRGWQGNVSPDVYAEMIEYHITHSDRRVVAGLIFITDYRNNEWQNFDTNAAHNALLSRKDRMIPQVVPPSSPGPGSPLGPVPPPEPPSKPLTGEVVTRKPSNIRNAPNFESDVLEVAPIGTRFTLTGDAGEFYRIEHKGGHAYVHESVVSRVEPTPPVQPPAQGATWARSMAFVERWEGEYQNNPADKGNWTGCEVGKGINKGTKYGISACSYPNLDIVNLRREEARELYRRDYWAKSGADKLEWPLCLLVMDSAVLHGVGAATKWLAEVGPNPYAFASKRLHVYTKSDNGDTFWRGWVNRVGELLEEIGK